MPAPRLEGCQILIVEDEYLLADEMRAALLHAGAEVLGPAPTLSAAAALIGSGQRVDGALLDINLDGALVFDLADALRGRGVPIAFATGYDGWAIPERFADVPRLEKPVQAARIASLLAPMLRDVAIERP